MKKSRFVTLVLAGALVGGCDQDDPPNGRGEEKSANPLVTNNTYVAGRGYYHAPYHGWYQYPYNAYRPGHGYYHGGLYSPTPEVSPITASQPHPIAGLSSSGPAIQRGGFGLSARSRPFAA